MESTAPPRRRRPGHHRAGGGARTCTESPAASSAPDAASRDKPKAPAGNRRKRRPRRGSSTRSHRRPEPQKAPSQEKAPAQGVAPEEISPPAQLAESADEAKTEVTRFSSEGAAHGAQAADDSAAEGTAVIDAPVRRRPARRNLLPSTAKAVGTEGDPPGKVETPARRTRQRRQQGSTKGEEKKSVETMTAKATAKKTTKVRPSSKRKSARKEKERANETPKKVSVEQEATEAAQEERPRRILIDCMDAEELRIAVLERETLEELFFERPEDKKYLGNIYKGRVVNLEPAIQAAFVEIGIGRNGFLHVSDVLPIYSGANGIPIDSLSKRPKERKRLKVQDILQKGQEVLVQISKDSIGGKGPSLTTYISIPGKNLVLMPAVSRFGVSKRIQDRTERAKLRESFSSLNPPKGLGFIIRTAGKDKLANDLKKDLKGLATIWEEIREKALSSSSPSLLYQESDLLTRALRDVCGADVEEVVVNDEEIYQRVRDILRELTPQSERVVKLYSGALPLFSKFKVEEEIARIYNRRIPLPSGGYLIIDQTEALVAIDVNSGKYTDEEDLEETALKTNLEAAVEIARQLRLRDLGGVIVNDFIDMVVEENRRKVEKAFRAALKRGRAKCWMSKTSRFGIIEMTRQRVRPSLERTIYEPCRHCRGTGMVKSVRTTGTAVLRQLREGLATKRKEVAEVVTHPEVQSFLLNQRRKQLLDLEEAFHKSIVILGSPAQEPDQFVIRYV